MLNLNSIDKPISAVVPIKNNSFTYNRKRYSTLLEDGWYLVDIKGNMVLNFRPDLPNRNMVKIVKGYTYNNSLIPYNFDSARRNYGVDVFVSLNFNNIPTMSAVEAVVWEDNSFYFYQQDFMNTIIFEIQNCIDNEGNIDIKGKKGFTPEIKTLLLFHSIEKKNQIALKKQLEEKKKIEEFKKIHAWKVNAVISRSWSRNYKLFSRRKKYSR